MHLNERYKDELPTGKEEGGNQQGRQLVKNYVILTQVGEE
jgi:hypothetical protein